jgi:hypothetical protein
VLDRRKGSAQSRRPEEYATDNLPDCRRLPEPGEQGPDTVRGKQQDRQRDQQPSKINICECHGPLPQSRSSRKP